MRRAVSNSMVTDELSAIPDMNMFKPPTVLPGNNCNNNDKPFFLDIQEASGTGLEITICVFLAFELERELSTDDLFDEIDAYIELEFDTGFVLKGAFSAGIKMTVFSLTEPMQIELDPMLTQLYVQADASGSASLGLFSASVSGNAELLGEYNIAFCSTCAGEYPEDGYRQASEGSSFYIYRLVGYDLDGELNLYAGIPGLAVGGTGRIGIEDNNVFDNVSPVITLPEFQVYKDIMKFTPQNAVSKYSAAHFYLFQNTCLTFFTFCLSRYVTNDRCNARPSHKK